MGSRDTIEEARRRLIAISLATATKASQTNPHMSTGDNITTTQPATTPPNIPLTTAETLIMKTNHESGLR